LGGPARLARNCRGSDGKLLLSPRLSSPRWSLCNTCCRHTKAGPLSAAAFVAAGDNLAQPFLLLGREGIGGNPAIDHPRQKLGESSRARRHDQDKYALI